jgi:GNAT superfamily N-acetyltransferase
MAAGRGIALQGAFAARVPGAAGSAVQQKKAIQRSPNSSAFQVDLRPKSGGWPLPRDVQAKMEAALGANFSDIRVHVGPEASSIGAVAFTWRSDIHFAPGQYNPHTPHGQFLLGHELAHVVQQRAGRVANPFGGGVAVVQDHALESEADRMGQMAARFQLAQSKASPFPSASSSCASNAIDCKPVAQARYNELAPAPIQNGWAIRIAAQGQGRPAGSLQMTRNGKGVLISDLKVAPEHRRHGVAGQLLDAALRTARRNGLPVAQLEARPDSPADITTGALVTMYQGYGFRMSGLSSRGNPLMERRA